MINFSTRRVMDTHFRGWFFLSTLIREFEETKFLHNMSNVVSLNFLGHIKKEYYEKNN
jgi:hypothetical protein